MMLHERSLNAVPGGMARRGAGSRVVLVVLAVVGGLLVVGCLACGGLTYFGFNRAMGMLADLAEDQYGTHPVVAEHLGEMESLSFNVAATGNVSQELGEDYLVFDVQGTKGDGQLLLRQGPGGQQFASGILRTPEGDFPLQEDEAETPQVDAVGETAAEDDAEAAPDGAEVPAEQTPAAP